MNRCSKSGIHEHSSNRQIHIQIFHGIARLSSVDFPDHGEDGFHVMGCVRRYLEIVPTSLLCPFLTFWINWRIGSMCKGLPPLLHCFGQQVPLRGTSFSAAGLSESSESSSSSWCDGFLRCSFINPPRYASFSRTWDVDAASNELGSILISMRWTCRNKIRGHIHHCWSRLGHNSFFFLILNPLRHCGAAYQAEILETTSGAEMADVEQMKKIVLLITRGIPFSQHVCELVFGVNVTDLNFWVQIDSIKQPIQSNSVGSWHMSHCGTSAVDNHFNYSFIVLKHIQHSIGTKNVFRLMERDQCWSDRGRRALLGFVFQCFVECLRTGFLVALYYIFDFVGLVWWGRNEILQSLNPKDRERESHPFVNLHREKQCQIP